MSYMSEVAKMLDVELGEFFEIYRCDGLYFLCHDGLYSVHGFKTENMLSDLLSGKYKIKRKPWKPNHGDTYYCVNSRGCVQEEKWYNDVIDNLYYKLGNCHKNRTQAEANRDKWISFYKSDEVLEM